MTPSCPSSRRRSSGKSRRSTETGREGIGLQRSSSSMWRTRGSREQVLRLVQRTWTCGRARGAETGKVAVESTLFTPRLLPLHKRLLKSSQTAAQCSRSLHCAQRAFGLTETEARGSVLTFAIFLTLKNVM